MNGKYDDMIHLPHHTSSRHPRMSMADRAAQFSPFAALTGHGAAISETARLTDRLAEHPEVAVTWFRADSQKEGGRYEVVQGRLRQIDTYARCLVLEDGRRIALDTVLELEILAPEESGE